jgi:hypothetical protein
MRLDSALKKVVPDISRPKKSRHFLMHWMSVKLPDNFQIREHSWPCLFPINLNLTSLSFCSQLFQRNGCKYKIQYYLKKKEVARIHGIEYPAIRVTSFFSIVVYLTCTIMLYNKQHI